MARSNYEFEVGATPWNVGSGSNAADGVPIYANRVFVQMKEGGAGMGYVCDGIRGARIPDITKSNDVTAGLAPSADDTHPGGEYGDADEVHGINMDQFWVHGSTPGDKIRVSVDWKN